MVFLHPLLGAARFLRWRRLEHLVQTEQFWQIGECLLAKRRRKKAAQDYLGQSLPYLRSPQEPLRREAIRFIGLLGQHLTEQQQDERERIYQGEPGSRVSGQPAGGVPVPCSHLPEGRAGRPAGTRLSSSLCSLSLRPPESAARPQCSRLLAGPSDPTYPAGNEATSTTRRLGAALLQAPQRVEEVLLLPGRQLSALQSSRHLLLPAAQLCSSGTSLPRCCAAPHPALPPPSAPVPVFSLWEKGKHTGDQHCPERNRTCSAP
ncbi:uncharacterized protein LOC109369882 [Meleagris gallopavo]|uniref:uncharacterized protein LOC109369882 n=1 Tax=Meleagris gallopavo TaxID=9103 RepID=UPI00093A12C5|nr:uncharacterized protein LOC109369882 [Meleagris gallopavo]